MQTSIVSVILIVLMSIISAEATWMCTCKTPTYDYTFDVCTEMSGNHPTLESHDPMICGIDSARRYGSFKRICVGYKAAL
ncbi:hypothetical protein EC991_000760 [Linnemannia zychae]|nr:hypothetical protein EC991_000760 [Linnemannia zychae]